MLQQIETPANQYKCLLAQISHASSKSIKSLSAVEKLNFIFDSDRDNSAKEAVHIIMG